MYNLTEVFTFLDGGWNKTKFDLPIFRDNLLVFNQLLTYDNSEFIIDSRLKRFLWQKKRLESWAKKQRSRVSVQLLKSLI